MQQGQSSSAHSLTGKTQDKAANPLRVGVGGPVGSGKTAFWTRSAGKCVKNMISR